MHSFGTGICAVFQQINRHMQMGREGVCRKLLAAPVSPFNSEKNKKTFLKGQRHEDIQ
nr:MAG TPA: hypothetical protein [Bacteriophage sp.]